MQELADRIIRGGETPDLPPPRVVTLLVGYNNVRYRPDSDVADKIDWLLQARLQERLEELAVPCCATVRSLPPCPRRIPAAAAASPQAN